jgi:mRNA interferase HigB
VRVISRKALRSFWGKHPDAKGALQAWFTEARKARWRSTSEVKQQYPSASFVANSRIIFNVKGYKYRLIVLFRPPIIYIRFVGTHAEYDQIDAATI